jgi:hypothetical protein
MAGYLVSCVLLSGGSVVCFGFNVHGEVGIIGSTAAVGKVASDMGSNLAAVQIGAGEHISQGHTYLVAEIFQS